MFLVITNPFAVNAAKPQAPQQWSSYAKTAISGHTIGKTEGQYYNDEGMQAFRKDAPGYAPVISLYREKIPGGAGRGVQAAVENGQCVQWCELAATYTNLIKVGTGKNGTSEGKDDGPTTVNGQAVEKWTWTDGIGPFPIDSRTLYLSRADNSTPVELIISNPIARLHEKSDFTQFSTEPLDPSTFAVAGLDKCKKAPGCSTASPSKFWNPALEVKMAAAVEQA